MDELVWYAAYGSNMDADRFRHYLEGGQPEHAARAVPGARDPAAPRDDRPVALEGCVYFSWESLTWGGGIAFYDPDGPGESVGRAYLLTREQLSDVAIQEMHTKPGADLDLTMVLRDGRHTRGPGRYETLHQVGEIDGRPIITFTAPWTVGTVELRPPVEAYVRMMAAGLVQGQAWTDDQVLDYLLGRPGVTPGWDRESLAAAISARAG